MILLLDTHVFLWWDSDHAALPAATKTLIADAAHRVLVSAGSVWEIAIKRRLGKLSFDGSPTAAIAENGFEELAILPLDAEQAGELAWAHADPFDRPAGRPGAAPCRHFGHGRRGGTRLWRRAGDVGGITPLRPSGAPLAGVRHEGAKRGVDARLVTRALPLEPLHDVVVDPQREQPLRRRHDGSGACHPVVRHVTEIGISGDIALQLCRGLGADAGEVGAALAARATTGKLSG